MFSSKQRGAGRSFGVFAAALAGLVAATPLAGPLTLGEAAGQPLDALYGGKQIRMVIAAGAGGGYDAYARILALHLSRHIPGNPAIIDQNMPSAAGMQAMNWAPNGPRDGTVILATYTRSWPSCSTATGRPLRPAQVRDCRSIPGSRTSAPPGTPARSDPRSGQDAEGSSMTGAASDPAIMPKFSTLLAPGSRSSWPFDDRAAPGRRARRS
jgi:hypothetical protein